MGHYVIGLQVSHWRPVVEHISGHTQWVFLESAHEYRPRERDRVLGFFGLTEVQLLQRCDVEVYAFTHRGLALPDPASAWENRARLEVSRVAPVQCIDREGADFEAGPQALLRATRLRQERVATAAPQGMASTPSRHPEPPAVPAHAAVPPSAPRGRLAAAHFNRVHRAGIALAAN
jgi:hypothetical protein